METPTAEFAQEKREVSDLLSSGVFNRAPSLAQFLSYVCAKYFDGAGDDIKEYNIAVEALGRPADFDQKTDSIVRVEAHRLRKRLREYYQGPGADHAIQIELPAGQYVPRFHVREPVAAVDVSESPPEPRKPLRAQHWLWGAGVSAIALAAGVLLFHLHPKSAKAKTASPQPVAIHPAALATDTVRILAGFTGGSYVDRIGRVWQSDQYFDGGAVFGSPNHWISGTRDPQIYRSRREGVFQYDIPLAPGVYDLRLHFAETVYGDNNPAGGGESSRVFHVFANGKEILRELDVVADVGPSFADIRAFKDISPAADGKLHLRFEAHSNAPFVNAIEITPGVAGHLQPIRLVAQDRPYTDKSGRVWQPDQYASGGQLVARTEPVTAGDDPQLYRGERFGNLRYLIPAPPGRYSATFHFAESWFGAGKPGDGGAGSRLFDILINGVAVRRQLDIYREAGGAGRAYTWTAHGLEPNHQGKLVIALLPVQNYACLNALEITDESPEPISFLALPKRHPDTTR